MGKMMPAVTFDLDSLTLGELMEAEKQSGTDGRELLQRATARVILAVFVSQWRASGRVPSWNEVAGQRLSAVLSSTSDSPPDDPSTT